MWEAGLSMSCKTRSPSCLRQDPGRRRVLTGMTRRFHLAAPLVLAAALVAAAFTFPAGFGSGEQSSEQARVDGLVSGGVPVVAATAYLRAADDLPHLRPECGTIPVELLAGIGSVESNHGRHGGAVADRTGDVRPRILGPDTRYGQAQGPMQFIDPTWDTYAGRFDLDASGDGHEDPQNLFDAARAAAFYLCDSAARYGGRTLADPEGRTAAVWYYNNSDAYVERVLGRARLIRAAMAGFPEHGDLVRVDDFVVNREIAGSLAALLQAAAGDGVLLSGEGWRPRAWQIELRRQACGTTHHDIWERPASECSPPTAVPGQSRHQAGLAVDFGYNGGPIESRDNEGYRWLAEHAPQFGLHNLPAEPWHWSSDGH